MSAEPLNSKKALEYLGIPKKDFENYYKFSEEIKSRKRRGSYFFKKEEVNDIDLATNLIPTEVCNALKKNISPYNIAVYFNRGDIIIIVISFPKL